MGKTSFLLLLYNILCNNRYVVEFSLCGLLQPPPVTPARTAAVALRRPYPVDPTATMPPSSKMAVSCLCHRFPKGENKNIRNILK